MVTWRRVVVVSLALVSLIALYQLIHARTFQIVGRLVSHVHTPDNVIALTFDDGPEPMFTEQIVTMLQEVNVPATFFVTGSELEQRMAAGQHLVAAGHALGNHILPPLYIEDVHSQCAHAYTGAHRLLGDGEAVPPQRYEPRV